MPISDLVSFNLSPHSNNQPLSSVIGELPTEVQTALNSVSGQITVQRLGADARPLTPNELSRYQHMFASNMTAVVAHGRNDLLNRRSGIDPPHTSQNLVPSQINEPTITEYSSRRLQALNNSRNTSRSSNSQESLNNTERSPESAPSSIVYSRSPHPTLRINIRHASLERGRDPVNSSSPSSSNTSSNNLNAVSSQNFLNLNSNNSTARQIGRNIIIVNNNSRNGNRPLNLNIGDVESVQILHSRSEPSSSSTSPNQREPSRIPPLPRGEGDGIRNAMLIDEARRTSLRRRLQQEISDSLYRSPTQRTHNFERS